MTTSSVKAFAADPKRAHEAIGPLVTLLERPGYENAVKMALIATTPIIQNDRNWKSATGRFRELFPEADYPMAFNPETLRRYALSVNVPHDGRLKAFILLFVASELEQKKALWENSPILVGSLIITRLVGAAMAYIDSTNADKLHQEGAIGATESTIKNLSGSLLASSHIGALYRDLFGIDEKGDKGDTSYYIIYRYSTKAREIVKTFVAIQTPRASVAGCFSFTHVYPGVGNRKRTSRGVLVKLDNCIHLIGGSADQTLTAYPQHRGVKIVAIPTGISNPFLPDMATGVFLSQALGWQPIVGRCAMVHVGFKSKLGRELRDEGVKIGVLKDATHVAEDLHALNRELKFGANLGMPLPEVAEFILDKINNMPRIDRDVSGAEGLLRSLAVEDDREPME